MCTNLRQKWNDWNQSECPDPIPFTRGDLKDFSPMQIEEFLAQILSGVPLSIKAIEKMAELYELDSVRNAEIRVK